MTVENEGRIILQIKGMPAKMRDPSNFTTGIPDDVKLLIADVVMYYARAESMINQSFRLFSVAVFNKIPTEVSLFEKGRMYKILIAVARDMNHVSSEKVWRLKRQHGKALEYFRHTLCHCDAQGILKSPQESVFLCGVDKYKGYIEIALLLSDMKKVRDALSFHCAFLIEYIFALQEFLHAHGRLVSKDDPN